MPVKPFAGMRLKCTRCRPKRTLPTQKADDPDDVVRCSVCGKKHSRDSLEVA